jgi:FMN-dependent NADH-azoreductase
MGLVSCVQHAMNLIINSSPKDAFSVGVTLAERLAKILGGPRHMIRLYDHAEGYFDFQFHDAWINEVMAAKSLIIPVAMWNFTIPAALKDFIDKISKRGRLWDLDKDNRMIGLLADRPVYIIMTSGFEYETGHPQDFILPYLRTVWASFGVHDVREFRVGGVEGSRVLCSDENYLKEKTEAMTKAFGIEHV